ncbi:hypothetical protein V8C86DRAFT_2454077 [Haematococcus lacustris]
MSITATNPAAATPIRNPILSTAYGALIAYAQFWIWAFSIPYNITKAISPDFVKSYVLDAGQLVWEWTLPALTLIENTVYAIFHFVDVAMSQGVKTAVDTHRGNTQHFKVAIEAYLRLIQHKAEVIEKHGLRGIPVAFSAHAA